MRLSHILRVPLVRPGLLGALLTGVFALGALIALAQDASPDSNPPPLQGTIIHTLQYGDVLDVIAQRYDVSLRCIVERNGLNSTINLLPGYPLELSRDCPPYDGVIPRPGSLDPGQGGGGPAPVSDPGTEASAEVGATIEANPGERVHIVRPGDVLDLIALSYDIQLQCLRERNEITNNLVLFPGDILIIPASCPAYDGRSTLPAGWRFPTEAMTAVPSATVTVLQTHPAPTAVPVTPVVTDEIVPTQEINTVVTAAANEEPLTLELQPVELPVASATNVG